MMNIFYKLLVLLCFTSALEADKITIFAASDLKYALDNVKKEFLSQNPKNEVDIIYGSSGKGMHQIQNGAPYDIFFSANMEFTERMYKDGDIVTQPKLYAIGRIVLWSKHKNFNSKDGFNNLKASWVQKIAIASPMHAPYGEKAKQSLEALGIYENVKDKLVLGENISQTTTFVASQSADIGIIALSLALAPAIANSEFNKYYLIDNKLHKPLEQGYGITKYGSKSPLAKKFYDFMETTKVQNLMNSYGFTR